MSFALQLLKCSTFCVNLKALDSAEGTVQRFRALRATQTLSYQLPRPPPRKDKNIEIESEIQNSQHIM